MTLTIGTAVPADLDEAEVVMRRVLQTDLGGYRPEWHGDLDDLATAYLDNPRAALLVARLDGVLVGTAAVRPCVLQSPPNPEWLIQRYNQRSVCQLVRVWIDAGGRRQGAARGLVKAAARWAVEEAGYATVYLHTDASAPGAESFWRSLPTVEVYDARPDPYNCVHFELEVDKLLGGAGRP